MKNLLFISIAILALSGCEKSSSYSYQVVNSDIVVTMNEALGNPDRSFTLKLKTDQAYPCINYSLITDTKISGNNITVEVLGLYIPDICLTAIGPASAALAIPDMQDMTYNIVFKIGTNISYGRLTCSQDQFSLGMDDPRQVKISEPVLKRVPDNLIWGTVGYHEESTLDRVNEFLNSLKEAGAYVVSLDNGNYNYFEIENNRIKEPVNSGYWFTRSFVYGFTGDKEPVRSVVKDYGKNYGDLMSITLSGDLGEEYLSWVLKNE